MKLARARLESHNVLLRAEDTVGVVLAKESKHPSADVLRESLSGGVDFSSSKGERVDLDSVEFLSPIVNPTKLLGVGLNYADHARESGVDRPPAPVIFAKTSNAITGPNKPIHFRSPDTNEVDYEAELAVVIGKRARDIDEEQALSVVLGYTICNDVSARDAQVSDGQWLRGKSFDTFAPIGPWIVTSDEIRDPQNLAISCRVNGELLQDSNTAEMIFGVRYLVAYISRFITLEQGDVIATGTPHGVGFARTPPVFLRGGDVVEAEIEGIGRLVNPVVAE